MQFVVHDQNGYPLQPEVLVELADDVVPVPPGHRCLFRPWLAPGRDGAGILALWVPADAKDAENDPSVPVTIRTTTINLKQLLSTGLKPGLMPRDTLQARLLDYMRISIERRQ